MQNTPRTIINPTLWSSIPPELRALPQWCVAGSNKAPMSRHHGNRLRLASTTEASTWMTFEDACQLAWENVNTLTSHQRSDGSTVEQLGYSIGFVTSEDDPYTCIDLDVKPGMSDREQALHNQILQTFLSYTERSLSGNGWHIWVRGNIGRGFRRQSVEVYSQERFIICTGNVPAAPVPIQDGGAPLLELVASYRRTAALHELIDGPQQADDWFILQTACNASNSEKFWMLWKGEGMFDDEGAFIPSDQYSSQSQADHALLDMLCFYTKNNEQVRRMFRQSRLGLREKAQRNEYLNYSIHTKRTEDAAVETVNLTQLIESANYLHDLRQQAQNLQITAKPLAQGLQAQLALPAPTLPGTPNNAPTAPVLGPASPQPAPGATPAGQNGAGPAAVGEMVQDAASMPVPYYDAAAMPQLDSEQPEDMPHTIAWPPGMMGALVKTIYDSSYLPIYEVALSSAIALMSGLAGREFSTPTNTGLNIYQLLVAKSGTGKEEQHLGVQRCLTAVAAKLPQVRNFVVSSTFASVPALTKGLCACPGFVYMVGELGKTFESMSSARPGTVMAEMRTQWLNLFMKSSMGASGGGIMYSDKEKNAKDPGRVGFSIAGEMTPSGFSNSMTTSMLDDGFLSRFIVIEYPGERPQRSVGSNAIDEQVAEALAHCAAQALTLRQRQQMMKVEYTEEGFAALEWFYKYSESRVVDNQEDGVRHLWSRAHLHALRLACLCAVADNPYAPVMSAAHAQWAVDTMMHSIKRFTERMAAGEVGESTSLTRIKIIRKRLIKYVQGSGKPIHGATLQNRKAGVVTQVWLLQNLCQLQAFRTNGHRGDVELVKDALRTMVENGELVQLTDAQLSQYDLAGRKFCYKIVRLAE